MQIGEIAKRTGFSKDTLRWYEKIGLITLDKTSRTDNNYRQYTKQTLQRLLLIKQFMSFGFTLKEIEELLYLNENDQFQCHSITEMVTHKLESIDQKIIALQTLKNKIINTKKNCSGNCRAVLYSEK